MKKHNKIIVLFLLAIIGRDNVHAQQRTLSLEELKSIALEKNKKLHQAQKKIGAAEAAFASAVAGEKPTLGASVTGIYLSNPINTLLPEFQVGGVLSAQQVLYAGGKIQNAKKIAQSAVGLQHAQRDLTEDQVILSVETAFWEIVNLKEKNILAEEYVRLLTALQKQLKNAFEAGITYKNDLLKVEVQRNEAELNLTKARDGLTMTKLSLAQIIGSENIEFDIVNDSTFDYSLPGVTGEFSVEKRPEIALMHEAVKIQELKTDLLKGDRRPTVALQAYGLTALGKRINFKDGGNDLQAFVGMVSVSIPIFDWGGRKQKVKEQQYNAEAQKIELEETKELLGLEVQNAWLQLQQSVKRIALTQKSLTQAVENLRLNQDRFEAGTVLGDDVLEAQVLWQKANAEVIDAKAEYQINQAKYKKAIGQY